MPSRKQVWISSLSPPLPLAVSPVPGGVEKFYQRRQLQDRRVILRPQERFCVSSWHRCGIQVLQRWEVSGRNGCGFFKRLYCCLNLGRPYQGDTLLPYPSLSRGEKKLQQKPLGPGYCFLFIVVNIVGSLGSPTSQSKYGPAGFVSILAEMFPPSPQATSSFTRIWV